MATIRHHLEARSGVPAKTNGAQHDVMDGTNFPVPVLAFDATTQESAFFDLIATDYGSGDVTVDIDWYAANATTGDVIFGVQLAAITPNSDSQDIETKAFATAATVTDSHLGTTGKRLHRCTVTLTGAALDSIASGDRLALKLYRDAADVGDTLANDALVTNIVINYSDT